MKETYISNSKVNGKGLHINESTKKGEVIDYIHGDIHVFRNITPKISKMMMDWIGVGRHSWIDTSQSKFRFINHSCNPNVALVSKRKVIAIKNIPQGSELFLDYSLNEAEDGWSITCSCGASKCRKMIGPIQTLPRATYKKYKEYIPKNFQKIFEIENT